MTERKPTAESPSAGAIRDEIVAFIEARRTSDPRMEEVVARVTRAMLSLLLSVEPEEAAGALKVARDTEVILHLLEQKNYESVSVDPSQPSVEERLLTLRIQGELLKAAGGALQLPEAAALLGIQEDSLREQIRRGALLGVKFRHSALHVPLCQFEGNRVVPGLERVLQALTVGDAWTKLGLLLKLMPALGGCRTLLDLVREGEVDYAATLATRLHETGGV